MRTQNRWKSKILLNRYLFQCESRVSALSERSHGLTAPILSSITMQNQTVFSSKRLDESRSVWWWFTTRRKKNVFFQAVTLQAKCAVALRSASRCRRVQTSVNMSKNFSGHFNTNVTARQPTARLPGPGEVDRNGQEYAHLHPTTLSITCQRLLLFL